MVNAGHLPMYCRRRAQPTMRSVKLPAASAMLTPQQFRVLQMVSTGLLNKQIAWELGVSEATIKAHMTAIMRKLGAGNRTQAVLLAGKLAVDPDSVEAPPEEGE